MSDRPLTKREVEVLALLAEGHNNESVGHQLGISENTVKRHRDEILKRLNCNTLLEAINKRYILTPRT